MKALSILKKLPVWWAFPIKHTLDRILTKISLMVLPLGSALAALMRLSKLKGVGETATARTVFAIHSRISNLNTVKLGEDIAILDIDRHPSREIASQFEELIHKMEELPRIVIIRFGKDSIVDSWGIQSLESLVTEFSATGRELLICGAQYRIDLFLLRAGILQKMNKRNINFTLDAAFDRAWELLATSKINSDVLWSASQDLGRFGRYPIVKEYPDGI